MTAPLKLPVPIEESVIPLALLEILQHVDGAEEYVKAAFLVEAAENWRAILSGPSTGPKPVDPRQD